MLLGGLDDDTLRLGGPHVGRRGSTAAAHRRPRHDDLPWPAYDRRPAAPRACSTARPASTTTPSAELRAMWDELRPAVPS